MKKEIKINGDLQAELFKGGTILNFWNGQYVNSCLVEVSKERRAETGFRFAYFQDLITINSDKMSLMKSLNVTKHVANKECEADHYSDEIGHKRSAENNPSLNLPSVINISWCMEDIITQAENRGIDLSEEGAKHVLLLLQEEHNNNVGINWRVVDIRIDSYLESIKLVKVQFLYNEENDEVFAFFPELDYDRSGEFKTSYAQVGQHSACHPMYANDSIPATEEQYKDLLEELKSVGYGSLEIVE